MTPTSTRPSTTVKPRPAVRRRVRQFVPPQHGAWAMLLVPWLVGILTDGFRWLHVPLLGAWLAGYVLSYYLLQAVKTRRVRRFRAQLLGAATPTVLLGGLVLALSPRLLWFAPAYIALLAVNLGYAWRRCERALVNDLASVLQSCLVVFVCASVAGVPAGHVGPAFLAVLMYFTGTVLYVKTMIRERDNARYHRASIAYHVLALGTAVWLSAPLAAVFALLLTRAWAAPKYRLTPKQVGLMEIVGCILVLAAVVAA